MKQGTTNIKIVYKPLNTSVSTTFLSGNPKQTFDSDSDTFQPDRRIDPLTIKVNCLVSDTYGFVDGSVNASLTDISWKILDSNGVSTDILSTNKNYKIGTGAEKGQLRVFQNVDELTPITIVFTASYLEPKSKRIAKFQESINLSTITNSATPLQLDTDMPMGGALYVTKDTDRLLARGRLFRGKDEVPASYYWYDANGNELTDTNGITGSKTKMISIPSTQISKSGSVVKLEVGDESDYYNSLLDDAVMNDAQVVEWIDLDKNNGRNLIIDSKITGIPVDFSTREISELIVGETYTLSFIAKKVATSTDVGWISVQTPGNWDYDKINVRISIYSDEWKLYQETFVAKTNINQSLWIYSSNYYRFEIKDGIKLEKGNTATNWSPALEDINNLIIQKKKDYVTLDKQVIEWQNLIALNGVNLFPNSRNERVYSNTAPRNVGTFELNTEYTISFDAKIVSGNPLFHVEFHGGINAKNFELTSNYVRYSHTINSNSEYAYLFFWLTASGEVSLKNIKLEKGNTATDWSPNLIDLNNLIASTSANPDIPVKLPDNYRPSVKPSKVYKGDFLMIKRYPSYTEEVLITQGGIDASASSVEVEMVIKTNQGVLQNPEKYFSVKWYKQSNGTFKYSGFKVNIAMEDIIALQSTGAELDYELTEIK